MPSRKEVYAIIDEEAEYAKKFDRSESIPGRIKDADKPLEVWLLWMEEYLAEARKAATSSYDKNKALDRLRCVLSLGVNAAVYLGLPRRSDVESPKPTGRTVSVQGSVRNSIINTGNNNSLFEDLFGKGKQ